MSYNPTLFEASDWWKASNCGTSPITLHFSRPLIGGRQATVVQVDGKRVKCLIQSENGRTVLEGCGELCYQTHLHWLPIEDLSRTEPVLKLTQGRSIIGPRKGAAKQGYSYRSDRRHVT